jgi:hypothetical protein
MLPAGAIRAMVIFAAMGFIPALVFAAVFESTPEGLDPRARRAGRRPGARLPAARSPALLLQGPNFEGAKQVLSRARTLQ